MQTTPPERVTLLSLCRIAHISVPQLAKEAGVEKNICYAVEIGGFCPQETAKKVLAAYNRLSGQHRVLADIQWCSIGRAEREHQQRH
jgi:hypothetical protein